jgi:hypothetical protein
LDESSNDDEEILLVVALVLYENQKCAIPRFRGCIQGHETLNHDRVVTHVELYNDYMHTLYPSSVSAMLPLRRVVFNRILQGVRAYGKYLFAKRDTTDKIGFSTIKKCIVVVWMLVYGAVGDLVDEYICMENPHVLKQCTSFEKRW